MSQDPRVGRMRRLNARQGLRLDRRAKPVARPVRPYILIDASTSAVTAYGLDVAEVEQ